MDYENMVMLVEAYEGFLELQKLIDAITGEKALYTFEDGVFGKLNPLFEVIFNLSVFSKMHDDKDKDRFYDVITSGEMDSRTKTRVILGLD
jgi:hypothetical protein